MIGHYYKVSHSFVSKLDYNFCTNILVIMWNVSIAIGREFLPMAADG